MKYLPAYIQDKLANRADFEANDEGKTLWEKYTGRSGSHWSLVSCLSWFHWSFGAEVDHDYWGRHWYASIMVGPFSVTLMRHRMEKRTTPNISLFQEAAEVGTWLNFGGPCPTCGANGVCRPLCPARSTFARLVTS